MHLVRVRVAPHTFDLPIVESMQALAAEMGRPLALVGERPPLDLDSVALPSGRSLGDALRQIWQDEGVEGYGHRIRHVERFLVGLALLGADAPWTGRSQHTMD